jgi:hypothetical protein
MDTVIDLSAAFVRKVLRPYILFCSVFCFYHATTYGVHWISLIPYRLGCCSRLTLLMKDVPKAVNVNDTKGNDKDGG